MLHLLNYGAVFLQQQPSDEQMSLVFAACMTIFAVVITVIMIAGFWKTFSKAGYPGWAAIIPIYNIYIILKLAGRPGWWLLLLLIPLVNVVVWAIVCIDVARSFGKDALLWGIILLWLLNGLGFLFLGFGKAEYQGPAAA